MSCEQGIDDLWHDSVVVAQHSAEQRFIAAEACEKVRTDFIFHRAEHALAFSRGVLLQLAKSLWKVGLHLWAAELCGPRTNGKLAGGGLPYRYTSRYGDALPL